ncbi:MAG: transglutaminase domain-containing protein [Lachnospiraceae bacterium]|nr:transglutaminase domain-containing protein [Lachnospiraceae bacterium]
MMILGFAYEILFILPLAFSVMSFAHPYLDADAASKTWLLVTLISVLYPALMKHLKIRGRALLAGVGLSCVLGLFVFLPAEERSEFITEHLPILWEALIGLGCFTAGQFVVRSLRLRQVLSVGSLAALVVLLVMRFRPEHIAVCMILLFALLTLSDTLQRLSRKEGDTDPKKHLVFISPFLLVAFVLLMLLPTPDKAYGWPVTKRIVQLVKSGCIQLAETVFNRNGWDSDSPLIGFSGRGNVGGNLSASDLKVMELSANMESDPYIYLAGRYFDSFDGRNWEGTEEGLSGERIMDTMESLCAVLDMEDELEVSDRMRLCYLTLQYKDLHTSCCFTPAKLVPAKSDKLKLKEEGANLSFSERKSSRQSFRIAYFRVNRDNEEFGKMLSMPHSVSPESWKEAERLCFASGEAPTYEDYLSYHAAMYERDLPETLLSPALREYMDEILEGAENDNEKLKRIEALLRSFRYTDQPGTLPEEIQDTAAFLDWFIFEKQEGYCTYFATAFVLLARAEGIPARFVQGFRTPMGRQIRAEVRSSSAHAWPEAYLEGIGWLNYEPTPGMGVSVSWETGVGGGLKKIPPSVSRNYPNEHAGEGETGPEAEEEEESSFRWYFLLLPLGSGVGFALLLYAADRLIRALRYKRLDECGKALFLCRSNMELLGRYGWKKAASETLSEYEGSIRKELPKEALAFLPLYEKLIYAEYKITVPEREALEAARKELRPLLLAARAEKRSAR